VPKEETTDGMEDTARHFHHVLHDFLYWCIRNGHVNGANCDHEV
jgi:hypothetical protein